MAIPSCEISIAAHYSPSRVPFLVQVLRTVAEWRVAKVNIALVTNDLRLREEPSLSAAIASLEERGYSVCFDHATGMEHPFHLTWWHKSHLRAWHAAGGSPDDLFIYLEDDIALSQDNLDYFSDTLPLAKTIGCIPGLIVYENDRKGDAVAVGYRGPQILERNHELELADQRYVSPKAPYWPGFILNRELCAEYLASPWSDRQQAETQPQSDRHSCRVHSAWALTYADIPPGLSSRYIVPVDDDLVPLPQSRVLHTAGNYVQSKSLSFGTVRLDDAILRPSLRANLRLFAWHVSALRRRAVDKLRRTFASGTGQ